MRYPQLLIAALAAAALLATGCGRVSTTQPALPSKGASTNKPGATSPYKGGSGTVTTTPGKAVGTASTGKGTITGRVVDDSTKSPVAGATVVVNPGAIKVSTDAAGRFTLAAAEGSYTFTAMKSGLKQISTNGVFVEAGGKATVPDLMMLPGVGASGITSMTFKTEGEYGRVGEAPATLIAPKAVAVRGGDVLVLDVNSMPGVKTGIIRQYNGTTTAFVGKYGDYSKWLGLNQMRNNVISMALDNEGRALVIDDTRKLWRFQPDGDKDKATDITVDNATDLAVDPTTGNIFVAHSGGVTRLNAEGDGAQEVGTIGECKAVGVAKDGLWVLSANKVQKLSMEGAPVLEFGAAGAGGTTAEFGDVSDLAVDPKTGNVVVVDKGTKNVYLYDPVGTLIAKVGEGTFELPTACAFDGTGRVFVVDEAKKKVYKFVPTAVN